MLRLKSQHRLMCGDSTSKDDVAKLMAGEKAELCFTSPPYADQREYNGGKELSTEHLARFFVAAADLCALFAVNLGISRKDNEIIPYWNTYLNSAKEIGLKLLSWNVWDQGFCGSVGKLTAMFPISHEWIFILGAKPIKLNPTIENKSGGEINDHVSDRLDTGNVKKKKNVEIRSHRELGTVFSCPPEMSRAGINHPAMFPIALPEAYIEACTNLGQSVYEPFCGSGTTLIACERTNRKCRGLEIDPHYCSVIIERWQQFTGKEAQLLG